MSLLLEFIRWLDRLHTACSSKRVHITYAPSDYRMLLKPFAVVACPISLPIPISTHSFRMASGRTKQDKEKNKTEKKSTDNDVDDATCHNAIWLSDSAISQPPSLLRHLIDIAHRSFGIEKNNNNNHTRHSHPVLYFSIYYY